ncbi:hypothetical protein HBI56_084300 [Parastagonospora nodorum]|nr:hypothetical protein HBH52_124690 [Parastagonospora nodorum]KAH4224882.1 hypothetical protein HBI06_118360 [Parastagonospora nodorum]KAH4246953.1 hypothetical protein HBI05_038740 [Parastagonospora nodorum]KAH4811770.1 hypothetical protein HBH61_090680 [Parastagonospora nodorum]KAH4986117.1 hypothetical protein HBI76_120760 [Parastagonospora nodorum]
MFKQAVNNHNAAIPQPAPTASSKQQSLGSSFARTGSTQSNTNPLASSTKQNGAGKPGLSGPLARGSYNQGTKRTSTGLAKTLDFHEDIIDYPTLNIVDLEKENDLPMAYSASARTKSAGLATALFDEDDFDSDIDLDVEDPATKGSVSYPKLPHTTSSESRDSGYQSHPQTAAQKLELDSSQPIPWSSSPLEHFKTPRKVEPAKPRARRAFLPWSQNQKAANTQEAKDEIDSEEEIIRPKKRQTTEVKAEVAATPKPKSQYLWNATASALKEQQKNLREQNKKQTKEADTSVDDLQAAVKKRKKNAVARIFLSEEQQNVLNLVTEYKKSVFFTGSAGTGKSVLLREIIAALRRKYVREPDRVAVTASTGLAACNVGGVTLHSFSGIGLGKEPAEDLIKKIRRNAKAKQRWMRTKVLIMDEVSMVDGDLFDKLEQIARTIRNNGRPFGGIQLVITGDFFQLPPVPEYGKASKFAFDAGTWTTSIEHTIGLTHVFRQKDPVFANMLNEMREGRLTPDSIARFRKLDRALPASDENIEATELFPTRQEVDRANNLRMQQLHGTVFRTARPVTAELYGPGGCASQEGRPSYAGQEHGRHIGERLVRQGDGLHDRTDVRALQGRRRSLP